MQKNDKNDEVVMWLQPRSVKEIIDLSVKKNFAPSFLSPKNNRKWLQPIDASNPQVQNMMYAIVFKDRQIEIPFYYGEKVITEIL